MHLRSHVRLQALFVLAVRAACPDHFIRWATARCAAFRGGAHRAARRDREAEDQEQHRGESEQARSGLPAG